ncbi:Carnitine O-acetyltransferase mitochondrial [Chytriomyces hyalinus]|nr:Carnitine O-acetyltransferase mitochondrial [Chytriomyces hyalinus]
MLAVKRKRVKPVPNLKLQLPKRSEHNLKRKLAQSLESREPHTSSIVFPTTASIPHVTGQASLNTPRATKNLFQFQNTLPKLPVPTLKETCITYLKSIRPLVSNAEYEKAVRSVGQFLVPGGLGEQLQLRLINRDNQTSKSWLIDWWNSLAYMAYRDPVVVFVSYYYSFLDDPRRVNQPAARAAEIIKSAMEFRKLVISEQLSPDMTKSGPLCSHQYRYLFNSTRIPQLPEDVTRMSDPARNNHVIIVRKNKFFKLDLVAQGGRELSTTEIQSQIETIYQAAGVMHDPAVGALTTLDRDSWTFARNALLDESDKNRDSLDVIERAVFVVCLDDSSPVTYEDRARSCWVGVGKNRFFDKSLQFIVFENGAAGFNGEHSMIDGTPTLRMCDWMLDSLAKGTINHGVRPTSNPILTTPKKLEFDLSPSIQFSIQEAESKFAQLTQSQDLTVIPFDAFGKSGIKKLKQFSWHTSKPMEPLWQQTGRSVSSESVAWVRAMENVNIETSEKIQLGRAAMKAQSEYMAMACEGKGVDRHFLGLRQLLGPGEEMPSIFRDAAFSKSSHWALSTSQISSEYFNGLGFGAVVPDGHGVGYMIKRDSLQFTITSNGLKNEEFGYYLVESLKEMRYLFA